MLEPLWSDCKELLQKKLKTKSKHCFQIHWLTKISWCEQNFKGENDYESISCKIYSYARGVDKILDAKDDGLAKHQGWKKAKGDLPHLEVKILKKDK